MTNKVEVGNKSSLDEMDWNRLRESDITNVADAENLTIEVDLKLLSEFIYRYEKLNKIVSDTKVDILLHMRNSDYDRFLTNEFVENLDVSNSTVSKCLSSLTDDGIVDKIGRGVYELND